MTSSAKRVSPSARKRTAEIPLTRGYVTIVDANLFDEFSKVRWQALVNRKHVYAMRIYRKNGKKHAAYLHREIMRREVALTRKTHVDHINQNSLDNRRANLRVCTNQQNLCNRPRPVGNTSGYKGVSWCTKDQIYIAQILVNGRTIPVLRSSSKIKAARAYDDAARKHHGEFACLNFPRRGERRARPSIIASNEPLEQNQSVT